MDYSDDVYGGIDQLISLTEKKVGLLRELKKCLRIADLVGVPPKELKGMVRVQHRSTGAGSSYDPKPWLHVIYSVRVGDGPWEDFPLKDVHMDLWPLDMIEAYAKWKRRMISPRPKSRRTVV